MARLPEDRLNQAAQLFAELPIELTPALTQEAHTVFACSDFVCRFARRHAVWIAQFVNSREFEQTSNPEALREKLNQRLQGVVDQADLMLRLRVFRNQEMVRIIWRHISRRSQLEETTRYLSELADVCIDSALQYLEGWLADVWGAPVNAHQRNIRLSVLALGKLGGGELNLSSDVDLIFAYSETGLTSKNKTSEQFFLRLSRQLISVLNDVTVEGFVFRVDMRLRPFGDSGALVLPFSAVETYYTEHGRDWERYAFIKARICAGDKNAGCELLKELIPFVYRRYLDFGAFDSLRLMQASIVESRKGAGNEADIKLGSGGIRDLEFMVQAQQLVWGGRKPNLQTRGFVDSLNQLVELNIVEKSEAATMESSYEFLRDVEHSLQAFDDQQTQTLPTSPVDQNRLAVVHAWPSYSVLEEKISDVRAKVSALFAQTLAQDEAGRVSETPWHKLGASKELELLLSDLYDEQQKPNVSEEAKKRLDTLMPVLLEAVLATANSLETLRRIQKVLRSVMRRSAYLSLLSENPDARQRFVVAVSESKWVAQRLSITPNLFDCLLDPDLETGVPTRGRLQVELESILGRLKNAGDEEQLNAIVDFKEFHVFRVAVTEALGSLPLMKISDYLTYVADTVIRAAVKLAISRTLPEFPLQQEIELIVVAYGKLGGLELGPNSDLDIVFIHDMPVADAPFLHRLSRRILHLLTLRNAHGPLYEIDVRLRPTGKAGTMMTSIESFRRYQEERAWVWEHQSLVRARVVVGSQGLSERFNRVRRDILTRSRQPDELGREIVSMRQRMREHQKENSLKHASGGIVDIEFVVQYLVLAWSEKHPSLSDFTDNVRIIAEAERLELLSHRDATVLTQAYLAYRSETHRKTFNQPDNQREMQVLNAHSPAVQKLFERITGSVE